MKISKIFKRDDEPQDNLPPKKELPKGILPEPLPEKNVSDASAVDYQRSPETRHSQVSVKMSAALSKELESEKPHTPNIEHLYKDLLDMTRDIYSSGVNKQRNFSQELKPSISKIIESILSGNDELLLICLRDYEKPEEVIPYHITNVVIVALAMGILLGYDKTRLLDLGVAAALHDIGLKDKDIINKSGMLSASEQDELKKHPEEGASLLLKIDALLSKKIVEAITQEHERADGSGYPKGLTGDDINEYAQIIGLADVYEALMHNRPYRAKYTSLETIRIILKNKKIFFRKILKALIEAFGIFPVETLVQLNTKEIGMVIKRNQELISRPVIDIVIDSYGKELKQPKRVNLADNPVIYIDTCVREELKKAS